MTFNSLEELFEEKSRLIYEKKPYTEALIEAYYEKRKSTKKNSRDYWNEVIENYKKIVNGYDDKIKKINLFLNNALVYPKELLIPFILECINLHEEEKYIIRNVVLSSSVHMMKQNIYPTFANYQLIFPERLLEEETSIEKTFYVSLFKTAYQGLFEKEKVKYIIIQDDSYISLFSEELNLFACFKYFPYLADIGFDLIERRLREPNKNLKIILNEKLEELKEKTKNKNLCK